MVCSHPVKSHGFFIKYGELPENFKEQMDASMTFYETAIPSIFIIGMFSLAFIFVTINLIAL